MATDPVCGMTVSSGSQFHEVYQDHTYLFSSERCMTKFRATPSDYTSSHLERAAPAPSVGGITYICPMHPEIVRSEPGCCPKCGMTLVQRKT